MTNKKKGKTQQTTKTTVIPCILKAYPSPVVLMDYGYWYLSALSDFTCLSVLTDVGVG